MARPLPLRECRNDEVVLSVHLIADNKPGTLDRLDVVSKTGVGLEGVEFALNPADQILTYSVIVDIAPQSGERRSSCPGKLSDTTVAPVLWVNTSYLHSPTSGAAGRRRISM